MTSQVLWYERVSRFTKRMPRKADQSCDTIRKTKKHRQDGKAHDVFIADRFFFATFIRAKRVSNCYMREKKTDRPDVCMYA